MPENITFTESELTGMKTKIEGMSKEQHIEILKIIKSESSIAINENKSGVFINLSYIETEVLDQIKKYIEYISDQENMLMPLETMKTKIMNENKNSPDQENEEFVTMYR